MKSMTAYLRDVDVAIRYDVSRPTIWRWVKYGKFPQPIKLSNGATRWRISDLLDWELNQNSTGGAQ